MKFLPIFYAAYIWFINGLNLTSLPKLYYRLSSKRGIPVKQLRDFEKAAIKYARRQLDVHYLEYCFDLGICPQKFKFKIPENHAYRNTKEFHDVALHKQINEAKRDEFTAGNNFSNMKFDLFSKLTLFEKTLLMRLLVAQVSRSSEKVIIKHSKKLQLLWRKQRPSSPDCLVNLSSRCLTIEEQEALRYGLDHHILPSKIHIDDLKVNIEKATWIASKQLNENESVPDDFRHKVIHAVHAFTNAARNICGSKRNIRKHFVLKRLAADESIRICKFDKGTGVCILNSVDYISKLECIVNDTSKFEKVEINKRKLSDHPVVKKYEKVKRYIQKYITKDHYDENVISRMTPGSSPGKLYGLAKVHKENYPLRPVCSMINTPEHCLAKFLDNIIKPHIPNQHMLNSTQNFLDRLDEFQIKPGDKMVSFDVVSLFTNVPLILTINIIADYVYRSASPPPFSKQVFKNMMKTATQGYFLFNDILYQQVDGVIMGSPLGPTMANFFLAVLEEEWLCETVGERPILYLRYVDDIFAIFRQGVDIDSFLTKINSSHPNIKFTVEEANETLPFLDVEIKLKENSYDSWVWRKKTHTGVLLNFAAIAPMKWKFGLIQCLLNRVWDICSSSTYFDIEVGKLRDMFASNGYPVQVFKTALERFRKFKTSSKDKNTDSENDLISIKIPFIGSSSVKFAKSLSAIFKDTFGTKLNPVYTSYKVKTYFGLKSRTPKFLCSNVIYEFKCLCDTSISYIGVTSRPLITRVEEHLNSSLKSTTADSAIRKHLNTCQKCFADTRSNQLDYFEILRNCSSSYTAKIQEALLIKRHNPNLNIQQFNKGASFTLKVYN